MTMMNGDCPAFDVPKVNHVQIDSLVVMKIANRADIGFRSAASNVAHQGILTGLISINEKRLEITNCFPTSNHSDASSWREELTSPALIAVISDDKHNEVEKMLKRSRTMNIDYQDVGFYQTHSYGACFNHEVIESFAEYQFSNPEAVGLIYDPIRTRQGHLSLKVYRLTKKALDLCISENWSIDTLKHSGLTYSELMEELPITIKSSHLINVLLAELALSQPRVEVSHMELGARSELEKSMSSSIGSIDELNKGTIAYIKYTQEKQKFDASYNALILKRKEENEVRAARGEPLLSLNDIKKMFTQPQLQLKNGALDLLLNACGVSAPADYQFSIAVENIAKLFTTKAASEISTEKKTTTTISSSACCNGVSD